MNPTAVEHLFRTTCAFYALALAAYLGTLATDRKGVGRAATALAGLGLAAHTVWIGLRWYLAAAAEVEAGQGVGWVRACFAHPPLTNLYESLIVTAWCMVGVYLLVEAKWKLRPVGVVAMVVSLAALAEAWLVTEKGLRPLAPALQSWWLIAHVVVLFVAYALFLVAAALAVLSLLKGGTPLPALGLGFAGTSATLAVAVGLAHGLTRLSFSLTPLYSAGGEWRPAIFKLGAQDRPYRWELPVPGAGPLLAVAIAVLVAAMVLYGLELKKGGSGSLGTKALLAGLVALGVALAAIVAQLAGGKPFEAEVPADVAQAGIHGPFRFALQGVYGLGALVLALLLAAAFVGLALWRERVLAGLPERVRLDDLTYRTILLAFPMLGMGIVMGAFWAYDAWGSYWSWDPKETWSLVTFLVYALYLHTRRTLGWTGRRTAVIAIVGFALVVFTYLGVNLGLTGDGLHTYGSG